MPSMSKIFLLNQFVIIIPNSDLSDKLATYCISSWKIKSLQLLSTIAVCVNNCTVKTYSLLTDRL